MSFPNVICDDHPGQVEPGYCVCLHVALEGAPVAHVVTPSAASLGEILCTKCSRISKSLTAEDLVLCCAPGVRERGWDKASVQ